MILVTLKPYLANLESRGYNVPSLSQLARDVGCDFATVSRIANNHVTRLNIKILDAIIIELRQRGFNTGLDDLLIFESRVPDHPSLTRAKKSLTIAQTPAADDVWARVERGELPDLATFHQHAANLDALVAGITEENRHDEVDFGPPVGKEVW